MSFTSKGNGSRVGRLTRRLAVVTLGGAIGVAVMAAPAWAHRADVVASVSCTGLVTYTANAVSDGSKTNTDIGVFISTGGGVFTPTLPNPNPAHQFNEANGFSFTDTFQLASPLPVFVVVKVQAQVPWSDGAPPGESRQAGALHIPGCEGTTTTTAATTTTTAAATTTTTTTRPVTTTTVATTTSVTVGSLTAASPTTVAAAATNTLPVTGGATTPLAPIAVGLLAIGALLLRVGRRVTRT
jgi:hypothetical protein